MADREVTPMDCSNTGRNRKLSHYEQQKKLFIYATKQKGGIGSLHLSGSVNCFEAKKNHFLLSFS
jgi:hypothetical protein